MNQTEAKNYLQAIANIWTKGDIKQLEKYYAQDFQANYYGNKIHFNDLVNRLNYLNLHQRDRKMDIFDVMTEPDKIAVRFHYYAIDDVDGVINTEGLAIYHLNKEQKIVRAWSFADRSIDYIK